MKVTELKAANIPSDHILFYKTGAGSIAILTPIDSDKCRWAFLYINRPGLAPVFIRQSKQDTLAAAMAKHTVYATYRNNIANTEINKLP